MKGSVFVACSLDGFIARLGGEVDFLPSADPGEDFGYFDFVSTVDALVMGRNSYERIRHYSVWPYKDKKVIVLSRQPLTIPDELIGSVESSSGTAQQLIDTFEQRGWKHIYVEGGKVIQSFLKVGFVQQLIITRIPILLGEGIPLFGPLKQDLNLEHRHTKIYDNGIVQSRYDILYLASYT
jgi:dihydrofolate reductase